MAKKQQPGSWVSFPQSQKFHFFRGGESLCKRWSKKSKGLEKPFSVYTDTGLNKSLDKKGRPGLHDCKECFQRRARERGIIIRRRMACHVRMKGV